MKRADVHGSEIAYDSRGDGDPIVLLHCGFIADAFVPLIDQPALARWRLVLPRRRGYGESSAAPPGLTLRDHATDVIGLLDALGIQRAHVVGHSIGASVALELALAAPDRVRSVVAIEPPLPGVPSDAEALQHFLGAIGTAMGMFANGRSIDAIDLWLTGAFGPGYRAVLDARLPGWLDRAVADCAAVFGGEGPALQQWQPDLSAIRAPLLSIVHADPWPGFREGHEVLLRSVKGARGVEVANVTHLMHLQDPASVATAIARFVGEVP